MNIAKRFAPVIILGGIIGALTLRWLALDLLYRLMPEYITGVGSSMVAVIVLGLIVSVLLIPFLSPIDKISDRIRTTGEIRPDDRDRVLRSFRSASTAIIIENVIGFIIGQLVVMIADVKNGVVPYQLSRLVIIMIQATFVGGMTALYEIYILDALFADCRRLLKIHSMSVFGGKSVRHISSRILLVTAAILVFMGLNAFTCGYAFIHGDNIPEGMDVLKAYLWAGVRCVVVTFVECIGLIWIVIDEMNKRIVNTTEIISELEKTGDLSTRINISMTDDIGNLISCLNAMMDKIESMVRSLRVDTNSVSHSADVLTSASSKSLEAIQSMKDAVAKIDGEDKKTNEIISTTFADIESLKENAQQVERQVETQSASVEHASASVTEMTENIGSIAETAKNADAVSEKLRATSAEGAGSIKTAEQAIAMIQESAQQIQESITMIQKIASQTNLLAMNASIEAAHAGSYGTGFAVVADEVRNLANTSASNAQTIKAHMKDMAQKIANGVDAMQKAGESFTHIDAGISDTANIVRSIAQAVEEQREGTADTLKATNAVVESISSIKSLAVSQREHTENVYESTGKIVASSKVISTALEQTSAAAANLDEVLTAVDHCASDNTASVAKMKTHIDTFRINVAEHA